MHTVSEVYAFKCSWRHRCPRRGQRTLVHPEMYQTGCILSLLSSSIWNNTLQRQANDCTPIKPNPSEVDGGACTPPLPLGLVWIHREVPCYPFVRDNLVDDAVFETKQWRESHVGRTLAKYMAVRA